MKKIIFLFFAVIFISCENFATLSVVFCSPANSAFGVDSMTAIEMEFSADVNKSDIEKLFSLSCNSGSAEGVFTWLNGRRFIFTPRDPLANGYRYIVVIPRSIRDKDGNTMKSDFMSEFYVGSDLVRPSVIGSIPAKNTGDTTGIDIKQNIIITFSEPMDRLSTQNAFAMSPDVAGYFSWSNDDTVMTYNLTSSMIYGTHYRFSLGEEAKDKPGNKITSSYTVFYITGEDFTNPVVNGIFKTGDPLRVFFLRSGVSTISKKSSFSVEFSEEMKQKETESAFSIIPSTAGSFSWNSTNTVMTFIPEDYLSPETDYVIQIDGSASDVNGRKTGSIYQVVTHTGASDSLLFHIGAMSHSNDNITYTFIVDPASLDVPLSVDIGGLSDPNNSDSDTDYFFKFSFLNSSGQIVAIDTYSVLDTKILIDHFINESGEGYNPAIEDIWFNAENTEVTVKIKSLPPKTSNDSEITRFSILGGTNGIKDKDGNYMGSSFIFEFTEQY